MYTQSNGRGTVNIPVNYGGTALRQGEPYIEADENAEGEKEPLRVPPTPSRPTVERESTPTLSKDVPVFFPEKPNAEGINFSTVLNLLKLGKMKIPFLEKLFWREGGEAKDVCDFILPATALVLLFCKEPDRLGGLMLLSLLLIQ